jgi:hypothetical protein
MSTTYTKSLATDFGGSLDIAQFHDEIDEDSGIAPEIIRIDLTGDVVDITFDAALSGAESTTLDGLISSHTPDNDIQYSKVHTAYAKKDFYNHESYKDISTYVYGGWNKAGMIKDIVCVAYRGEGITDFSIRIYDDTHNNVIAEKTFTNDTRDSLSLTPLSNIPKKKAIITVQIKKSGGNNKKYVYIENIQFRI